MCDRNLNIEKQTPKKPKVKPRWDSDEGERWWIYHCPSCDRELRARREYSPFYSDEKVVCNKCGQEIDWS